VPTELIESGPVMVELSTEPVKVMVPVCNVPSGIAGVLAAGGV
jgi:hypothetical protein